VGDLFSANSMRDMWFGYSLHHRSSIFESSSAFGRISGGSNYNTLYLQYHF
jgi:outer membrane protein